MTDDALKPAIQAALRMHEIGRQSPYQLFFAGKGKSGASFGAMQGDLAAGQPVVTKTFTDAMSAGGLPAAAISSLLRRLSIHLLGSPLSQAERNQVNAALLASRNLVDAMDETITGTVYASLDTCISHAYSAGRSIAPEAQILMAMWINMTGPPTKLLIWIDGADPGLAVQIPPAGHVIDASSFETYLRATDYYMANPQNFPHLLESLAAGVTSLPQSGTTLAEGLSMEATETISFVGGRLAAPSLPDDGYVYEQATGRMFARQQGLNDLLDTGYSGSETDGGKNDPTKQCERDIGPIPRGIYTIGDPFTGPSPFSLRLTPEPENDMCGRTGFLIHGDSIAAPGTASQGCIILRRASRERIYQDKKGQLMVVERLA